MLEKLLQTDKGEILLNKMFEKGKRIFPKKSISDIKKYSNERLLMLPEPIKRIKKPIKYNVKVCNTLLKLKNQIIADYFKEAI